MSTHNIFSWRNKKKNVSGYLLIWINELLIALIVFTVSIWTDRKRKQNAASDQGLLYLPLSLEDFDTSSGSKLDVQI